MGQKVGKGRFVEDVLIFTNLPRSVIYNAWQNFNNISDGFGISVEELQEILADLSVYLNLSKFSLSEKVKSFFSLMDTDDNGLIDALEMFGTLVAMSGMSKIERINFILSIYDFDSNQSLYLDEVILALKSVANGLCKIQQSIQGNPRHAAQYVKEELIEELVTALFVDFSNEKIDSKRVDIPIVADYLLKHPDVLCWMHYFTFTERLDLRKNKNSLQSPYAVQRNDWDVCCEPISSGVSEPWLSSVAMLVPTEFANIELPNGAPDSSVQPSWVYGYSSRLKGNIVYNFLGKIIYSVSRFVIVYDSSSHSQEIFNAHESMVHSLALHPNLKFAASGDIGSVMVWHTSTKQVLYSKVFGRHPIKFVQFSPSGQYLLTIISDGIDLIYMVDWSKKEIIYTQKLEGSISTCTILSRNSVVVAGDGGVQFLDFYHQEVTIRTGIMSRYSSLNEFSVSSHLVDSDNLVLGSSDGEMQLWIDVNCVKVVKGHADCVNALACNSHGLVSGGDDKRIRIWTNVLEPIFSLDVSHFGLFAAVKNLSLSSDGTSIAFGTEGSNIYEVSVVDGSDLRGGPVAFGHSKETCLDLSIHPSKYEFATVGDDCTLRIFDCRLKSQIKLASFDSQVMAVAYSPLGDTIVVGFGGIAEDKTGSFIVLNEEDLLLIHEARDSTFGVSSIKFSVEGETLAVGFQDGSIYLYAVQDEYELIGRCVRHEGPVISIDFSKDGEWLRSNSSNKDLCYFNTDDASFQSNYSAMRDVQFATDSCIYSWHLKSIHSSYFSVERATCADTSANDRVVAVGSTMGYLRLFRYPCNSSRPECHRYRGHSAEVGGIKFSYDGNVLLSFGSKDICVVQWAVIKHESSEYSDGEMNLELSIDLSLEIQHKGKSRLFTSVASPIGRLVGTEDARSLIVDGDSWFKSLSIPTSTPKINIDVPALNIRLERIYGSETQMVRNNVNFVSNDMIVYISGKYLIFLNIFSLAQKFCKFHSDSISAIATSSCGRFVATGNSGVEPKVAIWRTDSCVIEWILPEIQKYSVAAIAFSPSNQYLAVVGGDDMHTLSIYCWKTDVLLSRCYCGGRSVLGVCFNDSESECVVFGHNLLSFAKNVLNGYPSLQRANFGDIGRLQIFLCCEHFVGFPTIGTGDGNFYIFQSGLIKHSIKAHIGAVNSLSKSADGKKLVSGGSDGIVRLWDEGLQCLEEFNILNITGSFDVVIRSVSFDMNGKNLLIATRSGDIFVIDADNSCMLGNLLVQGHGIKGLFGLATHPTKHEFATSGDDCTIRLWDANTYKMTKLLKIDTASRCITFSPDGKLLVVGFGDGSLHKGKIHQKEGTFSVLKSSDLKVVHEARDSSSYLRVLRFSPDGRILCCGSEDACIYMYNTKDSFSRRSTLRSHQAPIFAIDFSLDGKYIMSADLSKRVCFCESVSGNPILSVEKLRDEKWATISHPFNWSNLGFWMAQQEGVDICLAQKSSSGLLTAVGLRNGRTLVSHNPCPQKAGFLDCLGHTGNVAQLCWLAGDTGFISISTNDHSIMQWKCIYDHHIEDAEDGFLPGDISDQESVFGVYTREVTNLGTESTNKWMSNIAPPSSLEANPTLPPQANVYLEHIYGLNSHASWCPLKYNFRGCLVYISSLFGVIFDRSTMKQTYYRGHSFPIISLDVNNKRNLVASGERAPNPECHVWDANTGMNIIKFSNVHTKGISVIKFSCSSAYLVTAGQDMMNSIAVHFSPSKNWTDGFFLCSCAIGLSPVRWICFSEVNEYSITVGGMQKISFLRIVQNSLELSAGTFGKSHRQQALLCGVTGHVRDSGGEEIVVTGTTSGYLYIFLKTKVVQKVAAHDRAVCALCRSSNFYISGGKEGFIKVWSIDFELLHSYKVNAFSSRPNSLVCIGLDISLSASSFVVAMKSGELYEISMNSHSVSLLVESHSIGDLSALDYNPVDLLEFATGGDDGFLKIWCLEDFVCTKKLFLEYATRALAYSPDGKRIVVGIGGSMKRTAKDGAFIVVDCCAMEIVREDRKAKQSITDIQYNMLGDFLALGCSDGRIYLHSGIDYELLRTIEIPERSCGIAFLDFSLDSKYLRVSTDDSQLYVFTISGSQVSSPMEIRDLVWLKQTCPYSWATQGLFNGESNVVAMNIHPSNSAIIATYNTKDVRVYSYPCQNVEAPCVSLDGVSTKGSRVLFSPDGSFILVLDAAARVILQYRYKANDR